MTKETGGPAFPTESERQTGNTTWHYEGMTLRQYAAIKLKVPDSGTEWLDEMIAKSLRDDFAAKAMQSAIRYGPWSNDVDMGKVAEMAYYQARTMLEARK